jgi:hypothetical protein
MRCKMRPYGCELSGVDLVRFSLTLPDAGEDALSRAHTEAKTVIRDW